MLIKDTYRYAKEKHDKAARIRKAAYTTAGKRTQKNFTNPF